MHKTIYIIILHLVNAEEYAKTLKLALEEVQKVWPLDF
jgi:hypothetical protein